ncbi:MAG: tetratricopeptide repeat protein [Methylococcaceae bacterium]|nr:tetratricopeptide repeat protein [Methylococcaceae bacterium]
METAIDPHVLYLILTAETALQRQQYEVALEAYLEASKRVDDVRVIEKAARIALFLDDLPKTEQAVLLWLEKDSKNITARRIALSAALSKKDKTGVLKHLDAILQDFPADFGETILEIQKGIKTDEDVAFAADLLEGLEKQHPQQAAVFLAQSILAIRQKDYDKATLKVGQALTLQPEWEKAIELEAELFLYSGKMAFKDNNLPEALAWFDKVKRGNVVFDASMAAVTVLLEQKNYTEAEARLEKLLKENPEQRMRLLVMKAEIENEQENYQQAFDILTETLNEWPQERDLLYARALTAEKLDDLASLESDLLKILELDPKDTGALNALGYTLVDKTTRYDEAEKYLKQALELEPDEAVIIDSFGWLKFKQGDLPAALNYLQKAYEKMPTENEIVGHLAEILWRLDRKPEAKALFDKAIEKSPEDKYLLDFKTRILDKE